MAVKEYNCDVQQKIQSGLETKLNSKSIVLYETPKDCDPSSAREQVNSLITNFKPVLTRSKSGAECFWYPELNAKGGFDPNAKLLPFRVVIRDMGIANLEIDGSKANPKCQTAQSCALHGIVKSAHMNAKVVVETTSVKTPTKILEEPNISVAIRDGGASLDTVFNVTTSGGAQKVEAVLGNPEYDPQKTKIDLAIYDRDNKRYLNFSEPQNRDRLASIFADRAQSYRREMFNKEFGGANSDQKRAKVFEQVDAYIQSEKVASNPSDQQLASISASLRESYQAWVEKRACRKPLDAGVPNAPKCACNDFPCLSYSLPAMKTSTDQAQLAVAGMGSSTSLNSFLGVIGVVNTYSLKDEKVREKVRDAVQTMSPAATEDLNRILQEKIGTLNEAMFDEFFRANVPRIQVAESKRESNIRSRLEEIDIETIQLARASKSLGRGQVTVQQTKARQKVLNDEANFLLDQLSVINMEKANDPGINYDIGLIFDQVQGFNRYGIFAGEPLCYRDTKRLLPKFKSKAGENHDFAFEVPLSTLQAHLDKNFSINKLVCVKGFRRDCSDGQKLTVPNKPILRWKNGKYQVHIEGMRVEAIIDQVMDLDFDVEFDQCESGPCIQMKDPKLTPKTKLAKVFSGKLRDTERDLKNQMSEPVHLGSLDPGVFKGKIKYLKPIQSEEGLVLPIEMLDLPRMNKESGTLVDQCR